MGLLTDDERTALARLSVLRCATVEAAEAVHETRLDVLATLIDHHLVRRTLTQGGSRFRGLLETIHEYAAELLVADPADADWTRARLAEGVLALATEAEPHLSQDQQTEWFDLLETEHDNLRAALDHLDSSGDAEQQLALAVSLSRFWYVRGHLAEGRVPAGAHSRRPPISARATPTSLHSRRVLRAAAG